MLAFGALTAAQMQTVYDTLTVPHHMRVKASLLTLDHGFVEEVSARILDWRVDWSIEDNAPRSQSSVTLLDPSRSLGFDTGSPTAGQVFTDRLLRVEYGVWCPWLDEPAWHHWPIFTGRVVAPQRDGDVVTVVGHGKETLVNRPAWDQVRSWPRKTRKTTIIRNLLGAIGGEVTARMDIPDWPTATAQAVEAGRGTNIWGLAQSLAQSMDAQLFYDGRGIARLRRYPQNVAFTWTDGLNRPTRWMPTLPEGLPEFYPGEGVTPGAFVHAGSYAAGGPVHVGGTLTSDPSASYDVTGDSFVNAVWVTGKPARRDAPQPEFTAVVPRHHPLSPWRNERGGVPDFRVQRIDDPTIRSFKEAEQVATKRLDRIVTGFVDVQFTSLAVPGVEPGDLGGLATTDGGHRFRLREFTFDPSGMTVNSRARISRSRVRFR